MHFSTPEKNNPFIDKKNNWIWDKAKSFVKNTEEAVKKTLNHAWKWIKKAVWIGAMAWSSLWSPTFIATTVPASIETVSTISPLASTITLWTATCLLTACGGEDWPDSPIETKDTTPPTINISKSEVDITWWKEIRISWNQLYIWNELVASRNDDKTKNCKVLLSINWKTITSWTTISEEWTLTIKVSDDAWNTKNSDIKLNMVKNAPSITVNQYEVNIFWWVTVNINNNQLLFWDEVIASRNDDNLESCKISLNFNWKDIKSWDTINEWWTLIISVTNKKWITSTAEITLKNESIYGLENLRNATIQVDKEINLLNWITFADGVELIKTEIEKDGKRTTISDPTHYIPSYPWIMNIIFTIKWKNWNTAEVKVDNLNIKALEYQSLEIKYLQPKEILPVVWQINSWDRNAYEHIEHLGIAECTVIRDMMRKYWAWNYTPEQYQKLMLRLNTWTIWWKPLWFDNYELIGKDLNNESEHEHNTRDILNTIIKHANFIVLDDYLNAIDELYEKQPTNSINIFAESKSVETPSKEDYNNSNLDYRNLKKYLNKDNFIRFVSWSNLLKRNNTLKNKICQENSNLPDEHSIYSIPQSQANSKNDTNINRHIFLTVWTNKEWNTDISNSSNWSKFPIWFNSKVLFSWRAFPYHTLEWNVYGEDGNYVTSFTNYTNLASTDLCYQMKADVTADQLMPMIRNTALTDQIHLDWQTQNLYLINPAWYAKEYLMPTVPSEITEWKTISLEKWFYKLIIFDIPWAEVYINGEWIRYNKENQSLIKSQNPLNLKWRLNWDLCKKMWYNKNNPIKWKIIMSDNNFNWLNITKDVTINIK